MRPCPKCNVLVPAGRVVCERCGADVPPDASSPEYARGAVALLKTRTGIRIATLLGMALIMGGGTALGVDSGLLVVIAAVVMGVGVIVAIVAIYKK